MIFSIFYIYEHRNFIAELCHVSYEWSKTAAPFSIFLPRLLEIPFSAQEGGVWGMTPTKMWKSYDPRKAPSCMIIHRYKDL